MRNALIVAILSAAVSLSALAQSDPAPVSTETGKVSIVIGEASTNSVLNGAAKGFSFFKEHISVGVTEAWVYKDDQFEHATAFTTLGTFGDASTFTIQLTATYSIDGTWGSAMSYVPSWSEWYGGVGVELFLMQQNIVTARATLPIVGEITPKISRASLFCAAEMRLDNSISTHPQPMLCVGVSFPMGK